MGRGEPTHGSMQHHRLLLMIAAVLMVIYPLTASAAFLIRLHNGRKLIAQEYWEEANRVMFYAYGGVVGIPKERVKDIQKLAVPSAEEVLVPTADSVPDPGTVTGPAGDDSAAALAPAVPPPPPVSQSSATDQANLDSYRGKKQALQAKADEAAARYREAAANADPEAQERARLDLLELTRQFYALAEEVKQQHGGVLPAWWE